MFGMGRNALGAYQKPTFEFSAAPTATGYGVLRGTRVMTSTGWRAVEDVRRGDLIMTFDNGLVAVEGVTTSKNWGDAETCPDFARPVEISEGVIGNERVMRVLPAQPVIIESDTAEAMHGDPFVVIPAEALLAHPRVARQEFETTQTIVQLQFAKDQVVVAEGALILCPLWAELLAPSETSPYRVLDLEEASALIEADTAEVPQKVA